MSDLWQCRARLGTTRWRIFVVAAFALLTVGGCGDDDGKDDTTSAALQELAGSVEISTGTVDAMLDWIWRETPDGGIQRWETAGWEDMGSLTIVAESEPPIDGSPWLHVIEDSPEAVWVLVSDQLTGLNPRLVEDGTLPPDPPEDLRFASAAIALDYFALDDVDLSSAQFLIDCETNKGEPAVALVLTSEEGRPIARAWLYQGPLGYVHPSQVTCPQPR